MEWNRSIPTQVYGRRNKCPMLRSDRRATPSMFRKREKLTRGLEAESVGLETIDDVTCGVRSRSKEEESKRESLTLVCGYMAYGGNKRNVIFGGCSTTFILGYSKGGTVLNQIVTELGFSNLGSNVNSPEVGSEDIYVVPKTKEDLLNSISDIHYVDVGLNTAGAS
ncbi:hypothetical protein ACSQ67_023949 [Phaseolus vulgaris]